MNDIDNTVIVLIKGYAKQLPGGRWDATSTTTLVRSGGNNVIIDPGNFPKDLQDALEKEHLQISDVDWVVSSHSHQDHSRNSKLFGKDKVYNPFLLYKKIPEGLIIPGTQIKVIYSPGHVDKHIAFLVDTAEGKFAIAGDVFWWEDGEEQKTDYESLIAHIDPAGKDLTVLQESRKKLLSMADYVIPGHGDIFRVPGNFKGQQQSVNHD
jgi:glyoxylase-like metal-dependent hydrolase (beta-lactamase superfamily II)